MKYENLESVLMAMMMMMMMMMMRITMSSILITLF